LGRWEVNKQSSYNSGEIQYHLFRVWFENCEPKCSLFTAKIQEHRSNHKQNPNHDQELDVTLNRPGEWKHRAATFFNSQQLRQGRKVVIY